MTKKKERIAKFKELHGYTPTVCAFCKSCDMKYCDYICHNYDSFVDSGLLLKEVEGEA